MKKLLFNILAFTVIFGCTNLIANAATTVNVIPKPPKLTPEVKAAVQKYKQKNYVETMLDLENLVKKDTNNAAAYYYLALSYTRLGYEEAAQKAYQKVVSLNKDQTLTFYSKWASTCLSTKTPEACKTPTIAASVPEGEMIENPTDLDKFIMSGQQIHPSALDRIERERMERKIQEEEYKQRNQANNNLSLAPTNKEIIQALNTLQKIGYNPFTTTLYSNNSTTDLLSNPMYSAFLSNNSNKDYAKFMLYNQINKQLMENDFNNYGI